jgi:hypothetical protein
VCSLSRVLVSHKMKEGRVGGGRSESEVHKLSLGTTKTAQQEPLTVNSSSSTPTTSDDYAELDAMILSTKRKRLTENSRNK